MKRPRLPQGLILSALVLALYLLPVVEALARWGGGTDR